MTNASILVDTSVLCAISESSRPSHRAALTWLAQESSCRISGQIAREYLVVATRPAGVNGLGLPRAVALANLDRFLAIAPLLPEDRQVMPIFREIIEPTAISGKRCHDVWIAATAIAHGLRRLATLNPGDFAPFAQRLEIVVPV
jgi:predicted nucleic acid-binding protein